MRFLSYILGLFIEKKCYACRQAGHFFCVSCQQELHRYNPYCYVCKKPSGDFFVHDHCRKHFPLTQVIVLTRYRQNTIKRLLRHAKYYGKFGLYEDIICYPNSLFSHFTTYIGNGILIPVPMHFLRKWKRGYNQTEKIAGFISHTTSLKVDNKLLRRKRYTQQQSHLGQAERQKNLKDSFYISGNTYSNDTIIYLIDDVISTGSTLSEIAKTLQKAGFTDIRAIVIASD